MKKTNPLTIVHICLAVAAIALAIVCMVLQFDGHGVGADAAGYDNSEGIQRGIQHIIVLVSMCSCLIYVLKGYGKSASFFYNGCFSMQLVAAAFLVVIDCVFFKSGALAVLAIVVACIKAVALILLTFFSDLGQKRAFLLCYAIWAMDALWAIFTLAGIKGGDVAYRVVGSIACLVVSATVGLAIHGKYAEKAMRKAQEKELAQ